MFAKKKSILATDTTRASFKPVHNATERESIAARGARWGGATLETSNPQADYSQHNEEIMSQVATALIKIKSVCDTWKLPLPKFQIQGHTNAKPENRKKKDQMDLSEARAIACAEDLKTRKVNGDMLETKGFGGTEPRWEGSKELEAKNQRVEINLVNHKELHDAFDPETLHAHADRHWGSSN